LVKIFFLISFFTVLLIIMATKFPTFSQSLAQDPTTRRLWFGIATAHDFESHDRMTEERLYQKNLCFPFRTACNYLPLDFGKPFSCCLAGKF
jgi:hypothetical protein